MMFADETIYDLSFMADFTIVRLWYENRKMSLILILRDQTNNEDSNVLFLKDVINYDFNQIEFEETELDLHLPKFEIETTENQKSLKQLLQVLGINDAFDVSIANFKQMTKVKHILCYFFSLCFNNQYMYNCKQTKKTMQKKT